MLYILMNSVTREGIKTQKILSADLESWTLAGTTLIWHLLKKNLIQPLCIYITRKTCFMIYLPRLPNGTYNYINWKKFNLLLNALDTFPVREKLIKQGVLKTLSTRAGAHSSHTKDSRKIIKNPRHQKTSGYFFYCRRKDISLHKK